MWSLLIMLSCNRRFLSKRTLLSISRSFCVYNPPKFTEACTIHSSSHYEELYKESVEQPDSFWAAVSYNNFTILDVY